MKRFLEDKLVFGRTFRDSEFFHKFLLQPQQPLFNHLASGSEAVQQFLQVNRGLLSSNNQNKP